MGSPLKLSLFLILILGLAWASGCGQGSPAGPNIVVVVLDTVRLDATDLGASAGEWRNLTPQLAALAAEGQIFTNAWTTAPWTVPAHASMFTGLLPSVHGCLSTHTRLDLEHDTTAEQLAAAGYTTAAFYSNPWLSDEASGLLRGFALKKEAPIGGLNTLRSRYGDQGGRETLHNLNSWLEERSDDGPAFLFINFLEAHLPYDPPEYARQKAVPDLPEEDRVTNLWAHEFNAGMYQSETVDWNRVRQLYGGDVYTADVLLGELVRLLKKHALYEDTVLVVTSDHGENLGEHGLVDHQFSLGETLLAVPLVIRAPDRLDAGSRSDVPVQLGDIHATVLAAAGLPNPIADTHDLLTAGVSPERPLVAEYAGAPGALLRYLKKLNPEFAPQEHAVALRSVRQATLRLTVGSDGLLQLHDLATDPAQAQNLAVERPAEVARLLNLLPAAEKGPWVGQAADDPLDEATRAKLRSLGYVR